MEAVAQETGPAFYRDAYIQRRQSRPSEPSWLAERRAQSFARFLERGFPGPKDEAWRFTSTRRLTSTPWVPAAGKLAKPRLSEAALLGFSTRIPGAVELVFVNGRLSPGSSRGEMPPGVRVRDLSAAAGEKTGAPFERWLGRIASEGSFTDLNTAFFDGGVAVEIAPGAILENPIHLVFHSEEEEPFAFTSPRVFFIAGAGSQAQLIETYVGAGNSVYWTNAVTEILVRDGAILEHTKMQEESTSGFHLQTVSVVQERASRFTSHDIAFGGALARTDLAVRFDGEGGECTLNGLFLGVGVQHLDTHTLIDHAKPHCSSRELYKGILSGRARGVFHGTILVEKDAQKSDAIQTNKNLLLSREALVDSTPALEILADDVKCKHGSTIGQLDANALFYLRSRGIGETDARSLLIYAFAADILERLRIAPVRQRLEAFLGQVLSREQELAGARVKP
jgi:Fe-S cluster assembly protein SufD